jgi:hypothetical protein
VFAADAKRSQLRCDLLNLPGLVRPGESQAASLGSDGMIAVAAIKVIAPRGFGAGIEHAGVTL